MRPLGQTFYDPPQETAYERKHRRAWKCELCDYAFMATSEEEAKKVRDGGPNCKPWHPLVAQRKTLRLKEDPK